ncbi:ABC transporter ATP-binding protein [Effusibacillus pohliae]|uniref:ABC transporter ATP-binding protein n=1 Tax=Effusibacillus pohliae TaxID=232270 RepID=UPI0003803693|nr:ABC transporter ATP-binding protein [Effusibacillus pohliae]
MSIAILVEDLHKRYKDNHAVRGVSFTVEKGEIFGIVGPNGAGKTTTIEIMEGLRRRDSGTVRILGLDPDTDEAELRQLIGVQFQSTSIQERMKVKEAIELFSSFYRKRGDIDRIVRLLGLENQLDAYFKDLSGGWKQRVTLALATIHDPEVVFLDEPSTGLDPQARRELWDLIRGLREEGKTIVVTTHYMEEAEKLCDRVAMFKQGRVAALDTPKRLVTQLAAANFLSFASENTDLQVIRTIPGVERVERDGETIRVHSKDLQHASYHLFQLAHDLNWRIEAFRFEIGSLDDLFVELVEKERTA